MKPFFITCLLLSNFIFADYSQHQEAQEVTELLVSEHDFDKSYVEAILRSPAPGTSQKKILRISNLITFYTQQTDGWFSPTN